jgi:peptide deformylase
MAQVSIPTTSSPSEIRETVQAMLAEESLPQIVQVGHPVLRQSAARYDGQLTDQELAALIDLMRRVMHDAPGVGLAAPQLGIPLQLAVAEDAFDVDPEIAVLRERVPLEFLVLINPSYIAIGAGRAAFYEGCLSLTGLQAVVTRPERVQLTYTAQDGAAMQTEYAGWQARIVQHETDHLHGTLYIDKAELRSLTNNDEYGLRWARPDISQARQELGFLPD